MPTLRCASMVLTAIGCYPPVTWTSKPKRLFYKLYGYLILMAVQALTLSTVLDIVLNVKTQDEFSENLVLTIPMLITCCKFCSFLAYRDSIMRLINCQQRKPCKPADEDERNIESRFDRYNELITAVYTCSTEVCVVVTVASSLITNPEDKALTFRLWLPYDYSSPSVYAVTFILQTVSVTISSLMNVTYDSLFSGLMFCIYSQLEILGHRLQNIVRTGDASAKECARHHNFIYEFAAKVNEDFQAVLCVQFLASITIICFTLYRFTQTDLGSGTIEALMYAYVMLLQIFYYCWYGNEVKLKGLQIPNMIFASNWTSLDNRTRKILWMIMLRATYPIQITSGRLLTVNIESFMAVLKTSYSVYNVLQ
ncbi:odorant receptor Or1-like isoform X1 [Lasioglossum baleicum]|uniref:odorant receptor Or1-like isoform X1 n=1 Tax=Lasioglossum baleicum TaxID=434251 RepID=UPI003FCEB052